MILAFLNFPEITRQDVIQFCSNHFEFLMLVNLAILFGIVAIFFAIALTENYCRAKFLIAKNFLLTVVVGGEIVLMVLMGFVYWINYRYPIREESFAEIVRSDTSWVRNDIQVYFVEGNILNSVKLNGKDRKTIFGSNSPIREYHFSPDGVNMLIVTQYALYLLDRKENTYDLIDSIGEIALGGGEDLKGTISNIVWAPDSQKFGYEIAKWSKISSQDNFYVFDLIEKKKRVLKSPVRKISSIYWDRVSENMFYLRYEAKDTTQYPYPFEVRVIKIPYATLIPEVLSSFPAENKRVPIESLDLRGVSLFLEGDQFSFNRTIKKDFMLSKKGALLGIDDEDYLYVVRNRWFKKRLLKVGRRHSEKKTHRYQYGEGDLLIDQVRWIPGSRYAIMDYKDIGLIVLSPKRGIVGKLTDSHGNMFGWYQAAQ